MTGKTGRKAPGFGRSGLRALAVLAVCALTAAAPAAARAAVSEPARPAAPAASLAAITGAGSTWAQNAINTWVGDVYTGAGMRVDYTGSGSSTGRANFKQGIVDFAASEIPYGVADVGGVEPKPDRHFAYMPDVAGGTTFMYNLHVGNRQVTNLRLSGSVITDIFTGNIKTWNDARIRADNPQIALPAEQITVIVRSDGSGATAQFSQWMFATQPAKWTAFCNAVGRHPCTQTSIYPTNKGGMNILGQPGDGGVATYIAQSKAEGSIGYVEYSYAINQHFPVAKVLNAAGYYTEPTAGNVAVSLLAAKIQTADPNADNYLTQDLSGVYTNPDKRTYELSSYSYFILPTALDENLHTGMTLNKGFTLAKFGQFAICRGQTQVDAIGYSALPINLVRAGYEQLQKIPGSQITLPATDQALATGCGNPTFSAGHINLLADTDPMPQACDKQGSTQCSTGTGGAPGAPGPTGNGGGNTNNGGGNSGGGNNNSGGNTNNGGTGGNNSSGNNTSGGTNTNGTTGTNGSTGTNGTNGAGPSCDPNTGVCSTAGAANNTGANGLANGQPVYAVPVSSNGSLGDGVQVALMVFAAALLVSLGVIPPLLAQASGRRRQRRVDSYFKQDGGR